MVITHSPAQRYDELIANATNAFGPRISLRKALDFIYAKNLFEMAR